MHGRPESTYSTTVYRPDWGHTYIIINKGIQSIGLGVKVKVQEVRAIFDSLLTILTWLMEGQGFGP